MEVDVDGVQSDQEIAENVLLGRGNVGKEGGGDLLSRRELELSDNAESRLISIMTYLLADLDHELERLGVNVSDINTTLADHESASAIVLSESENAKLTG